jgi:hypothetical protein
MSREAHVRFWESAVVRFHRATQLPLARFLLTSAIRLRKSPPDDGEWVLYQIPNFSAR